MTIKILVTKNSKNNMTVVMMIRIATSYLRQIY